MSRKEPVIVNLIHGTRTLASGHHGTNPSQLLLPCQYWVEGKKIRLRHKHLQGAEGTDEIKVDYFGRECSIFGSKRGKSGGRGQHRGRRCMEIHSLPLVSLSPHHLAVSVFHTSNSFLVAILLVQNSCNFLGTPWWSSG